MALDTMELETLKPLPAGFRMIRCDVARGEEALKMGRDIIKRLNEIGKPTYYVVDETDEEFVDYFRDPESVPLGIVDASGTLAAVGLGSFRRAAIKKFAPFIPEDARAIPRAVAYVEFIQVAEPYRGLGFQLTLFRELETRLVASGARYLTGTVSPDNQYSLNNFLKSGYREEGRYIMEPFHFPRLLMVKRVDDRATA